MKNFKRNPDEKPYYFSSTVENGKVVKHEGDMAHAVYRSEMEESRRRSDLWHKWLEKNESDAYHEMGVVKDEFYAKHYSVMQAFMDGGRSE